MKTNLKFFKVTYRPYIHYSLSLVRLALFKLQGKTYEIAESPSGELVMGVIYTQGKCHLKALIYF